MSERKHWGMLAEFETPQIIYTACEQVRDEGFKRWDAHTPFPIHGLEKAMGVGPSKVPWITLVMGLLGLTIGLGLQWWTTAVDYPVMIAGKPFASWPAWVPVAFEFTILLGAIGTVFGMFALNKLPTYYHPLFDSERFKAVTDDKFFISIEATDPLYDRRKTKRLLKKLGATHIEEISE